MKLFNTLMTTLLFAVSLTLAAAAYWGSLMTKTVVEYGKRDDAAKGAIIGGAVGLGRWLLVGGIGIATGGTGFAIGAVGLTAIGAGVGGLSGAAVSEPVLRQVPYLDADTTATLYGIAIACAILGIIGLLTSNADADTKT